MDGHAGEGHMDMDDRRILSVCSAETPHAFLLCLFFEELYTSLYSISFSSSLTLSLL